MLTGDLRGRLSVKDSAVEALLICADHRSVINWNRVIGKERTGNAIASRPAIYDASEEWMVVWDQGAIGDRSWTR